MKIFPVCFCLIPSLLFAKEITTDGRYDFIVSVPDVHGDLDALLRTLWMAKAQIDGTSDRDFKSFQRSFLSTVNDQEEQEFRKSEKRVLLIQTGDIVDRGNASLSCYKAIWKVNSLLGWDVVNLIGNHEVMTMAGHADDYAHPGDVKEFGSLKARRGAFAPGGELWSKITNEFHFLAKVDIGSSESILFVHAGLDVAWLKKLNSPLSVTSINEVMMKELKKNPNSHFLASASSPIWTRELANKSEKSVCAHSIPQIFSLLKLTRIVVGHTPQEKLITYPKCGSKLILADVAMSRWMGSGEFGNPSAVLFTLGKDGSVLKKIHAVYWRADQVMDQPIFQQDQEEEVTSVEL